MPLQPYLRELPNGQLRPGWTRDENLSPGAVLEVAEHTGSGINSIHNGPNGMKNVLPTGSNALAGRTPGDVAQTLVTFYMKTGILGMAKAAQQFLDARGIVTTVTL